MEQELETTEEEFAGVKRKLRQRSEELEELQKEKRTADLMNENLTEKVCYHTNITLACISIRIWLGVTGRGHQA